MASIDSANFFYSNKYFGRDKFDGFKRLLDQNVCGYYTALTHQINVDKCKACNVSDKYRIDNENNIICDACNTSTSLTQGTLLEGTKIPLATWFHAARFFWQEKKRFSISKLKENVDINNDQTASRIVKKLREAVSKIPDKRLKGDVEIGCIPFPCSRNILSDYKVLIETETSKMRKSDNRIRLSLEKWPHTPQADLLNKRIQDLHNFLYGPAESFPTDRFIELPGCTQKIAKHFCKWIKKYCFRLDYDKAQSLLNEFVFHYRGLGWRSIDMYFLVLLDNLIKKNTVDS